jgi:pimeloyl-ACP methyl ester carboxylesterase
MEELSTKIGPLNFSYLSRKADNKRASIVFVHGFPFDKSIWNKQIASLPAQIEGFSYDIRGFGQSTPTAHQFFSIDLFAKDLSDFLDFLKIDSCIICGISMGGYIALRAAELFPQKVAGLILCDTNCVADSNESKIKRFASIDLIQSGGKAEFVEGFLNNVFSENTLTTKADVVDFLRQVINSISEDTICATQLALAARTDTSNVLPKLQVPTLIIRGAEDKLMTPEQTEQLHAGIRNSDVVEIPDSGHLPNLENPDFFNEAMNSFLDKHFPA